MRRFFVCLLALFVLCPAHPHPSAVNTEWGWENPSADTSCGIVWDQPILLSDTSVNAHSPQIALSGDDTVHVTWEGAHERLPYSRSTDGGISFVRSDILTDTLQILYSVWNRISANSSNVYVFFAEPMPGSTALRMKKSTDAGTAWLPVSDATDTVGEIRSSAVVGDTLSIIHSRRGVKYLLRSTDGGQSWTRTTQGLNYFARVALSPGVLHLVQIGVVGNAGETEYRRSHDLGDTWVQQEFLSTIDGISIADATIAASTTPGDSTVIAGWRDPKYGCIGLVGCSIIARSGISGADSTTWVPEQILTTIPRGFEPSLSVHNRRIAVGWPMDQIIGQSDPPFAEVRVCSDSSWCSIFDPTTNLVTRYVDRVSVALSSKAVHVVWSASQAPDPSTFRIFYRRGVFRTTDVRDDPPVFPRHISLEQNYPNPFNPKTIINFQQTRQMVKHGGQATSDWVTLKVFDMLGREVATLVDENREAGEHTIEWNAEGLASGVYYYRLIAGDRIETRKAVLIR